jgi:uncharacterized protein YdaU (DUF1376 family)
MHYYKFNIKDWTRDTAHLSVEEEGVYRRLLDHYYESEQPISAETQSVIRRLRLAGHEHSLGIILSEFFSLESDGYHHGRCDIEIAKYQAKAEANRGNGKLGGRPRKPEENPDGFENEPTDNLNHKPLTTNQEPEEIKGSRDQQAEHVPCAEIFGAYAKALPELPQLKLKDEARKKAIRSLWRQSKKFQTVDFWDRYFNYVRGIPFLMGMRGIGFDWLMKPANFKKVLEGNYQDA